MDELAGQLDQPGYPRASYWVHLASEFQVPEDVIMKCQHSFESSPSKHMLECKEGFDTNFSVQALKKGLRAISRNDLVQKIDSCRLPSKFPNELQREKIKVLSSLLDSKATFHHILSWLQLSFDCSLTTIFAVQIFEPIKNSESSFCVNRAVSVLQLPAAGAWDRRERKKARQLSSRGEQTISSFYFQCFLYLFFLSLFLP